MVLAIILITIGYSKAKKAAEDKAKFRKTAVWFAICSINRTNIHTMAILGSRRRIILIGIVFTLASCSEQEIVINDNGSPNGQCYLQAELQSVPWRERRLRELAMPRI